MFLVFAEYLLQMELVLRDALLRNSEEMEFLKRSENLIFLMKVHLV